MSRENTALRELVDTVIGELKARRMSIKTASHRLINAGLPFDAALRVISRNTC